MMHACIQDASRQDRAFTWSLRLLLGKCNTGMGWEKWAFIFLFHSLRFFLWLFCGLFSLPYQL
jgi:hypothetical protein